MAKVMLVGGAVRDTLMNIPPKDLDYVVVGSTPTEMLEKGFKCVGNDFPVFLHPETGDEHALARTERKSGNGYGGFEFNASKDITIEEDLMRRDLTMNAIAFDQETGEHIDPFGGIQDIKDGLIRHVSEAYKEDPLRVLRTARFLARYRHLGFRVATETVNLMREITESGELKYLTSERIWKELHSVLGTELPDRFFTCLQGVGALKVIMPELDEVWDTPRVNIFEAAKRRSDSKEVLYGVLLHALKNPESARELSQRIKAPKNYTDFASILRSQLDNISNCMSLTNQELIVLLARLDSNRKPERFKQICIAAEICKQPLDDSTPYRPVSFLAGVAESLKRVKLSTFDFSTEQGRQAAQDAKESAIETFKEQFLQA
ncbi:multifunctional CCA tRNA nucleotidyl transferase/2'3'-cyclic phosphodiesterase/2'nucleotidase/phosphatase [Photobacterium kishitanii]|uniref:Multifunctional CCA tRNA nucleotidyl transferase/2'3'-cyclic phosphodiesterase/2'nucleotidase/phosphatase n=1 Tax=Photobacterium kishitanii TaxID=318456 RepID=A0A2T3KKU0_9GAMM|nr:multifunctional CCA tRNA nucleotidyl transferase/2'3'-cyclic phosphodiesterase/2'nucleotidase/phosphatase [Photobacterium kishitanii]PSV00338.1 multifunctional CCA tRNA nucleotidyl transferase/2'3'-cyclic phosphodiesterase/2'nucleotidase/phosphatase [Photobacterium kishitanii]